MGALKITREQVAQCHSLTDLATEGNKAEIKKIVKANLYSNSIQDNCAKLILFEIFFARGVTWGTAYRDRLKYFTFEVLAFVFTLVSRVTSIVWSILIGYQMRLAFEEWSDGEMGNQREVERYNEVYKKILHDLKQEEAGVEALLQTWWIQGE